MFDRIPGSVLQWLGPFVFDSFGLLRHVLMSCVAIRIQLSGNHLSSGKEDLVGLAGERFVVRIAVIDLDPVVQYRG